MPQAKAEQHKLCKRQLTKPKTVKREYEAKQRCSDNKTARKQHKKKQHKTNKT